ncbi:hypothetical protein LTR78_010914 [Recurvomyces mirabilis]|uniref:Srp40 C-terminal domain-containing protein n=1 Tax=Recurvomyces mirabilis TaxID=574656 RepID=A0AAE0WGM8_9PEZI|nr:hypothetical protein LTR78_010914 [Recurvomyces mirabilis]KAK5149913.1 jun-like transcription factor [Recurvomyces mirabilis]
MARTKAQSPPVRDLLTQLAQYLDDANYRSTLDALLAEAREHNVDGVSATSWEGNATLESMWQLWKEQKGAFPTAQVGTAPKKESRKEGKKATKEAESSSEDSSDGSDSEDVTEGKKAGVVDDEAESTSNASSDEEEKKVAPAGTKRKREVTPDSSSDESSSDNSSSDSSDDSSDDEAAPPAKRTKTEAKDDSSDDDSSDDLSSDSGAAGGVDVVMDSSSDSSSGTSSSDSDSDSDSDSSSGSSSSSAESDGTVASSSSSSSSGSDSDSDSPPPPKKKAKKAASPEKKPAPEEVKPKKETKKSKKAKPTIQPAAENDSAASSVTLPPNSPIKEDLVVPTSALSTLDPSISTPASTSADETSGIHPDRLRRMPPSTTTSAPPTTTVPATAENVAKLKKSNVPFSRIPKDTFVDPKFSSNEYVSYDYADRAHRDLIVTKGKGFTKEKNKKKRGAYRGGAIDFTPKGIKFDD